MNYRFKKAAAIVGLTVGSAVFAGSFQASPSVQDLKKYWAGIQSGDYSIPYAGIFNRFLVALGLSHEVRGRLVSVYHEKGFHFVQGRVSTFGGPEDTGIKRFEKGAITGEILKELDSHVDYYAAMRFDYGKRPHTGKNFWKDSRLLIVNPKTGKAVIARPVDWGPNPSTNRIIDVSPAALKHLGLTTDEIVWVSFAEPDLPLGPVQ